MGELILMRKRGMTLSDFEKWQDEFEAFDFAGHRSYEEVQKSVFCGFNTLGLGVKDQTDLIEGG
jgi:hypothetical protein